MDFGGNKTPVEVIRESAFGGAFRDIYSTANEKLYKKSWEEFNQLILIKSIIVQNIMMLVLISIVLNVKHRLNFGKIKAGLMK